jgi:hypothetical protein
MKRWVIAVGVAFLLACGAAFAQNAPPGNPTDTGFMAQQPQDRLASRLVGLSIQNNANETIGDIYDIVLTDAGAAKLISSVLADFLVWERNMLQ